MVSVLQQVVRKHLGDSIPSVHDISKNVSFILQNGHPVVSYPRPLLPNVAEIACIHCKPASPLPSVWLSSNSTKVYAQLIKYLIYVGSGGICGCIW